MDVMLIAAAMAGASSSACFLQTCGPDAGEQLDAVVEKLETVGHAAVALELSVNLSISKGDIVSE